MAQLRAPQYDINGAEIQIEQMVDFTDVYRLEHTTEATADRIRAALGGLDQVVYVEVMTPLQADYGPPEDTYFDDQWGLENTGQSYPTPCVPCSSDVDVNALSAWDHQDTCTVHIGIMDYGIDYDHEDLADAVDAYLYYGEDNGEEDELCTWPHGSAIAGIVGAVGGNDAGVVGVASPHGGRFLVAMRVCDEDSCAVNPLYIADALDWATSTVFPDLPIINCSFGGPPDGSQFPSWYATLRDAYRNAYLKGLVLTASAGNNVDAPVPRWPASFNEFSIAVASVRCDGSHTPGYNTGAWIDLAAPGGHVSQTPANIVTTWGEGTGNDEYFGVGGRSFFGGTSASTAFASGVAGLIMSKWPLGGNNAPTNDDVAGLLKVSARDLGDEGPDPNFGSGLIRAGAALELVDSPNEIRKSTATPARISYVDSFSHDFMNIPCVTSSREEPEHLTAAVYEMVGYAAFSDSALKVWTRGRQSVGWPDLRPSGSKVATAIDGLARSNWAEVIPGTITAEGCSLRAYTYRFYRNGSPVAWYPVNGSTGQPTCSAGRSTVLAYTYVVEGDAPKVPDSSVETPRQAGGPNPSRQSYSIDWTLPVHGYAEAAAFDVTGRRVRVLFSRIAGPENVRLSWDGRDASGRTVAPGVYFLKMRVGDSERTVKVVR